jgi:AraC-like DNA-binding protein
MLNVKTVASSVGFADTAAFSKAFTRWTGVTPTEYRSEKLCDGGRPSAVQSPRNREVQNLKRGGIA